MKRLTAVVMILAAGSVALSGQRVLVYSEYQRVSPDGEVVKADRVERRREILSPAVARNAYATFRVAVEVPNGSPYTLYIAQNPETTAKASLYQEEYERVGEDWVADRVKTVELPVSAKLSEGQKVQTYLLDVFVPESTAVGRFRLEVQLNVLDQWVIYPMEFRVQEAKAAAKVEPRGPLPGAGARADATVSAEVRSALCGGKAAERPAAALDRVGAFVARNARQDLELAQLKKRESSPEMVDWQLIKAGGWRSRDEMCGSKGDAPAGAEWWLRARGSVYQGLAVK